MKPQDSAPLITALAPAAVIAPPAIVAGVIVVGLLWLLSSDDKEAKAETKIDEDAPPAFRPSAPPPARKVTREDLAESLAYGARGFSRKEAVAALVARGFRKTAAYKALAEDGRFADMIEFTANGLTWRKG